MIRYLARRLAFALFLVMAVSSASLLLSRLAPGDFVTESLGTRASQQAIEQQRARFGLNRSIGEQYRAWLAAAARLDFGYSMHYERPVRDLIPERAANTAILALTALVFATLIGVPLGIVSGSRRGGVLAGVIRAASVVLLSMPPLLTSLFLVFVAARTGWLPIAGMRSATVPAGRRVHGSDPSPDRAGRGDRAAAGRDARAAAGAGDERDDRASRSSSRRWRAAFRDRGSSGAAP